jgi:hypothetical protein
MAIVKPTKFVSQPGAVTSSSDTTTYADFVIQGQRESSRSIALQVLASPVGAMPKPITVHYPELEAVELHESFRSGAGSAGRALITKTEAIELGQHLATVLFPGPVFRLLAQSLAEVVRQPQSGLRIRLVMDTTLSNLPWEYVHRPDGGGSGGLSSFLLLDPRISMVREAVNHQISIDPITGRQELAFVGTFWEGKVDGWKVWSEFNLLRTALKPVDNYLSTSFMVATDEDAFSKSLSSEAAIFHYAGHCDVDARGRAYLVREMPTTGTLEGASRVYINELVSVLAGPSTRLAVLSACNSGFGAVVRPLLEAGIPALVGINGGVSSQSTIEFCAKMYESLAVGLSLDEAVDRARLHVMQWGLTAGLFDWGLYMVYMPSSQAVLFPRIHTQSVVNHQMVVRRKHDATIDSTLQLAREMDGMNFGEIMSELSNRRVLILGRFSGRRLKILKAIKERLGKHSKRYIPELFTFEKPDSRDLVEAIIGFAALSRFIIADISEPKSVQSELEAIVPHFLSVPVVPLINQTGKEYATFSSIKRRQNVVKPIVRYRDLDDLLKKLDEEIVPKAEAKLNEVRPGI